MDSATKIFTAIIIAAFIVGGFLYLAITQKSVEQNWKNPAPQTVASCGAANNSIVTKVIDGDTVVVEGGYHVRLLGIDADEKNYPCYQTAKTRLEELVLNKQVVLKKDVTDVDKYGRCLRAIFLGTQNIGAELTKEGLAVASSYEPDVQYKQEILLAEKQAMESKVGCKWAQ